MMSCLTSLFEGIDGEKIVANRSILAVRSVVFRKILFGQHREAENVVIPIGYDGKVLKAVKEYCYTDHADIFDEGSCNESWVRAMMQLASASDYFGLPMLRKKVFGLICSKMMDEPALSCIVFDVAEASGDATSELKEAALKMIRSRTQDALLPPESSKLNGVCAMRPESLTKILQDDKLDTDQIVLFHALKSVVRCR